MRWFAWVFVIACSASSGTATHPQPSRGVADAGAAVAEGPSEHECEELITHAIDLGMVDERAARPADPLPTDADRQALRTQLQPFADECRALPRDSYRCAIAASTTAELAACHSTPSNSTSNSSVAPGGITPPAPRSP